MNNKEPQIEESSLSRKAKNVIYRYTKLSSTDLVTRIADVGKEEVESWDNVGEKTIDEYIKVLSTYGRRFKRKGNHE